MGTINKAAFKRWLCARAAGVDLPLRPERKSPSKPRWGVPVQPNGVGSSESGISSSHEVSSVPKAPDFSPRFTFRDPIASFRAVDGLMVVGFSAGSNLCAIIDPTKRIPALIPTIGRDEQLLSVQAVSKELVIYSELSGKGILRRVTRDGEELEVNRNAPRLFRFIKDGTEDRLFFYRGLTGTEEEIVTFQDRSLNIEVVAVAQRSRENQKKLFFARGGFVYYLDLDDQGNQNLLCKKVGDTGRTPRMRVYGQVRAAFLGSNVPHADETLQGWIYVLGADGNLIRMSESPFSWQNHPETFMAFRLSSDEWELQPLVIPSSQGGLSRAFFLPLHSGRIFPVDLKAKRLEKAWPLNFSENGEFGPLTYIEGTDLVGVVCLSEGNAYIMDGTDGSVVTKICTGRTPAAFSPISLGNGFFALPTANTSYANPTEIQIFKALGKTVAAICLREDF